MSARAPASARGLPSARGGPLRERPQLSSRTNQPGGWWANMQKSANAGGQTARAARPVVQLDGRRPNTARGASETPTRSTRPAYGSPAQDLGNFQLRVTSSATLLIGAGEPEDCVLTKGASRVGLALWHECAPALKPQRAWATGSPQGHRVPSDPPSPRVLLAGFLIAPWCASSTKARPRPWQTSDSSMRCASGRIA